MTNIDIFIYISKRFEEKGFSFCLVGGTVRDYLLGIQLDDMDAVTDATPDEMKDFVDGDFSFAHLGCVKTVVDGVKFDITTLRKEENYLDHRHPLKVTFIDDYTIDVKRRDFTINGLYLNSDLEVMDFVNGQKDIKNKVIRTIGDASTRIKEDPLRIFRAIRFSIDFGFAIDENLEDAIKENLNLIERLNKDKIKQDIKKIKCTDFNLINKVFNKYSINIESYMLK